MLQLFSSLTFFLLARLSTAQFAAYPSCVQPLLDKAFPASCLSLSLVAQNTCLCRDANAFGSAFVTVINQQCGCADLEVTVQLTEAYCSQVGVDVGPAFDVFVQDNTNCDDSTGSGTNTDSSVPTSTLGSSISTPSASSSSSTGAGTGGSKSSDANKGLVFGQIVEIVVMATGGILALW